eukprot:2386399-Prymnesium_polylepis.1
MTLLYTMCTNYSRNEPAAHASAPCSALRASASGRSAVCLEKLGGCLSSARAGQRPPRGYIAK